MVILNARANISQLPWYSVPESQANFHPRVRQRRRRRRNIGTPKAAVALPALPGTEGEDEEADNAHVERQEETDPESVGVQSKAVGQLDTQIASTEDAASETSTVAPRSEPETPATSQAPSEGDFTPAPTTAATTQPSTISPKPQSTQQHGRSTTRTAIAVPNIPGLPRAKEASPPQASVQDSASQITSDVTAQAEASGTAVDEAVPSNEVAPKSPPPKAAPKSWADLVKRNTKIPTFGAMVNGGVANAAFQLPQTAPLAEALRQYNVQSATKLAFLEPRGLVNTGNMCYMNSVSQPEMVVMKLYLTDKP
jgi:ubiquitin carboxyl-terminal hydrolase 10